MCKYIILVLIGLSGIIRAFGQQVNDIGLNVGDTIPPLTIDSILNQESANIKIESLYKEGLLIISFWATWCSPCIEEMRLLDDLLKKGHKFRVLSVSHDSESKVNDFIRKSDFSNNLILTTDDKALSDFFKHRYLPHNIWVNSDGVIIAITGSNSISERNIGHAIEFKSIDLGTKEDDLSFNFLKPLHVDDSEITYRSIITGYNESINSGLATREFESMRFLGWNATITKLFWAAYTKQLNTSVDWNLIELHTIDSAKFIRPKFTDRRIDSFDTARLAEFNDELKQWDEENLFSYELRLPRPVNGEVFRSFMFQDLFRFFNISASIEPRSTECYVIKIDGNNRNVEKLKMSPQGSQSSIRKSKNRIICRAVTIDDLFQRLKHWFDPQGIPYLNETGIDYRFDVDLDFSSNENALNQIVLEFENRYGFRFQPEVKPYPILVLRDLENEMADKSSK